MGLVSGSLHLQSGWRGPRTGRRRKAWQEVRQRVLARDGRRCQIGLPGKCTGNATTVDHIRPIVEGGAELDESNLRAACHTCNTLLGARLGGHRLKASQQKWSRAW